MNVIMKKAKAYMSAFLCAILCITGALWTAPPITASAQNGSIHVYEETPGDTPSEKYTLTANGTSVPVIKYSANGNNFDIARFSSDDATPEYTVTVKEEISTVTVYPERYYPQENIQVSSDKHSVTFTLSDQLRYCYVMINGGPADQAGKPYLAIINDPTENADSIPDPNAGNVLNFQTFMTKYLEEHPNSEAQKAEPAGTTSGGVTYEAGQLVANGTSQVRFPNKRQMTEEDATYALQAALDEIYKDGSPYDTLYFPAGTYTWSGLEIRNRNGKAVTIYVEEGALMKNRLQECMQAMEPAIGIWDSSNITISGRGIFDGNGVENYRKDRHDAKDSCHQGGVMIVRSSNITFNDTYVRDAKQWNWESHGSKGCTLNNIKGLTPYNQPWVDGLDMASAQNLTINGAITLGNDDNFASGHYNPSDGFKNTVPGYDQYNADCLTWDTEDSVNISVNNTLGWSFDGGNGIRMGHNTYGHQMKNYTFTNVNTTNFRGGGRGITVQNNTNTYPRYESIVFQNCSFDTTRVGMNFQIMGKDPLIDTVTLDNCWFSKADAASEAANINNLTIKDLYIGGEKVTASNMANLTTNNITNFVYDWADNHAPEFQTFEGDPYTVNADDTLTFQISATDPDGDEVTLSVVGTLPDGAAFDPASGTFTWQPSVKQLGSRTLTFAAVDSHGASAQASVTINVEAGNYTVAIFPASEDTYLASWKTEKNNNYGSDDYLRVRRMEGSSGSFDTFGIWGEKITDTNDTKDAKISVLKFDAEALKQNLENLEKAELELTLINRRDKSSTGTDQLMAAMVTAGWDASTVTWLTHPEWNADNVKYSDEFKVDTEDAVQNKTSITDSSYDGTKVTIDVTDFVKSLSAEDTALSIAVCDVNGYELAFASSDGAAKLDADKAAAPILRLTNKKPEPTLTGITITPPSKTEYTVGDELNLEGLNVTATYSDGNPKDVTAEVLADSANMISGFDSSASGKVTVTVSYGNFTQTFEVTIAEKDDDDTPGTDPDDGKQPDNNPDDGNTSGGNTGGGNTGSGNTSGDNTGGSNTDSSNTGGQANQNGSVSQNKANVKAARTSDETPTAVYAVLLVLAGFAVIIATKKKVSFRRK